MPSLSEIDATIAALTAERKVLFDLAIAAKRGPITAIVPEWVWSVRWENSFLIRVTKQWAQPTIDAMMDAMAKAGHEVVSSDYSEPRGMDYILTYGGYLVSAGGGHSVLSTGHSWRNGGVKLTPDQIKMLQQCEVPPELIYYPPGKAS